MEPCFPGEKRALLLVTALFFLFVLSLSSYALPISSCNPDGCPVGYSDGGVSCSDGTCIRICVTGECSDTFTTVHTSEVNLDDNDIRNSGYETEEVDLSDKYIPTDTNKCYRFRQTTPSGFIRSSDIDDYESTKDFDSAIVIHWISNDHWYDNQRHYCSGEQGVLPPSNGAVWVDSDRDNGDDFDSADNLYNTNYLHCAPDQNACDSFNEYCDTDCYGYQTQLVMDLNANVDNYFDGNDFHDYCTKGSGEDEGDPVIDDVNFNNDIVYMYVDEFDIVNQQNDNQQCEYWPECNPADPCCTAEGRLRPNGYVCQSAHNAQCNSVSSCGGTAYEDRCTGETPECPDNNFEIGYNEACDGLTCVGQSCSDYTLQPERTCSTGVCQAAEPYACPYNLMCADLGSCKTEASSQDDCRNEFVYDPETGTCIPPGSSVEYELKYDANGNLVSGLGTSYEYNAFNRLAKVRDSATNELKEEYVYDQNGNRRKKVIYNSDGTTSTSYYVNNNFVQVVDSTGITNEKYYYLQGKQVGKKVSDEISFAQELSFYHADHLGSTRLVTDSNTNVIAYLSYKPFGEIIDSTDNERFLYTGKELDSATNNYYLGARYLNPAKLYSFTQPDQNIPNVYNPQDLNRYTYVRNNPYKYTDPDGKIPVDTLADVAFIISDIIVLANEGVGNDNVNLKALGLDIGGLFVPYITGVGMSYKATKKIDGLVDVKNLDKISDASQDLPKLRGKSYSSILKTLDKAGFEKTKKFEFRHSDGSKVRLDLAPRDLTPHLEGNNAHLHKFNSKGESLNDLGKVVDYKSPDAHIGLPNPPNARSLMLNSERPWWFKKVTPLWSLLEKNEKTR
jgi:RHS repeat-associated protein